MPISDTELQILIEKISLDHNWDLSSYKNPTLKRRIHSHMIETGYKNVEDYCAFLEENAEAYKRLIDLLTVNYTYWFRDTEAWNWILKLMNELGDKKDVVRIWSAGCASGEEAYSLAILAKKIKDFKEKNGRKLDFVIYASDIDEISVTKAKKGIYEKAYVNLDESELEDYFLDHGKTLEVKPELKAIIKFSKIDLAKSPYPRKLDIILCRNVMIYFEKSLQSQIYRDFYYSLAEKGYLSTGKTEVLPCNVNHLFKPLSIAEHIFQKA